MNRINQLFNSNKKDILSIYFCAGTPTLDGTANVIRTLEKHGVSMIEIGIPFSDPMADGIVIQNAATQALRNGMSLKLLFEQLRDIRKDVKIPLVFMGYLNPIMQFGFENFCRKCVECGIDGVIIPDLPFRVTRTLSYHCRALQHQSDYAHHTGDQRRTGTRNRYTYRRIHLHGFISSNYRSTTEFQRTKTGILQENKRYASEQSVDDRIWLLQ